jgi:predicted GNAT family acetyltransferase
MLLQIIHNNVVKDLGDRFIIESDGLRSYLCYRRDGITIDIYSAYVPEALRGNGHASSMILFALQYAVMNGLRVKANCPAVKAYLKVHPEWIYILDKSSVLN